MIDALIEWYARDALLTLGAAYFGPLLALLAVVLFAPKWRPSPVLVTAVLVTVVNVAFTVTLYNRAVTHTDAKIERANYENGVLTRHLVKHGVTE